MIQLNLTGSGRPFHLLGLEDGKKLVKEVTSLLKTITAVSEVFDHSWGVPVDEFLGKLVKEFTASICLLCDSAGSACRITGLQNQRNVGFAVIAVHSSVC